jgi:hypothetical protein
MSGIVRNCFSAAIMNVFRHVDASFRAFKTLRHPIWKWGTVGTFPKMGAVQQVMLGQTAPIFFSAKIKNLDINCSYFKHVDEKEEKPASHRK